MTIKRVANRQISFRRPPAGLTGVVNTMMATPLHCNLLQSATTEYYLYRTCTVTRLVYNVLYLTCRVVLSSCVSSAHKRAASDHTL